MKNYKKDIKNQIELFLTFKKLCNENIIYSFQETGYALIFFLNVENIKLTMKIDNWSEKIEVESNIQFDDGTTSILINNYETEIKNIGIINGKQISSSKKVQGYQYKRNLIIYLKQPYQVQEFFNLIDKFL